MGHLGHPVQSHVRRYSTFINIYMPRTYAHALKILNVSLLAYSIESALFCVSQKDYEMGLFVNHFTLNPFAYTLESLNVLSVVYVVICLLLALALVCAIVYVTRALKYNVAMSFYAIIFAARLSYYSMAVAPLLLGNVFRVARMGNGAANIAMLAVNSASVCVIVYLSICAYVYHDICDITEPGQVLIVNKDIENVSYVLVYLDVFANRVFSYLGYEDILLGIKFVSNCILLAIYTAKVPYEMFLPNVLRITSFAVGLAMPTYELLYFLIAKTMDTSSTSTISIFCMLVLLTVVVAVCIGLAHRNWARVRCLLSYTDLYSHAGASNNIANITKRYAEMDHDLVLSSLFYNVTQLYSTESMSINSRLVAHANNIFMELLWRHENDGLLRAYFIRFKILFAAPEEKVRFIQGLAAMKKRLFQTPLEYFVYLHFVFSGVKVYEEKYHHLNNRINRMLTKLHKNEDALTEAIDVYKDAKYHLFKAFDECFMCVTSEPSTHPEDSSSDRAEDNTRQDRDSTDIKLVSIKPVICRLRRALKHMNSSIQNILNAYEFLLLNLDKRSLAQHTSPMLNTLLYLFKLNGIVATIPFQSFPEKKTLFEQAIAPLNKDRFSDEVIKAAQEYLAEKDGLNVGGDKNTFKCNKQNIINKYTRHTYIKHFLKFLHGTVYYRTYLHNNRLSLSVGCAMNTLVFAVINIVLFVELFFCFRDLSSYDNREFFKDSAILQVLEITEKERYSIYRYSHLLRNGTLFQEGTRDASELEDIRQDLDNLSLASIHLGNIMRESKGDSPSQFMRPIISITSVEKKLLSVHTDDCAIATLAPVDMLTYVKGNAINTRDLAKVVPNTFVTEHIPSAQTIMTSHVESMLKHAYGTSGEFLFKGLSFMVSNYTRTIAANPYVDEMIVRLFFLGFIFNGLICSYIVITYVQVDSKPLAFLFHMYKTHNPACRSDFEGLRRRGFKKYKSFAFSLLQFFIKYLSVCSFLYEYAHFYVSDVGSNGEYSMTRNNHITSTVPLELYVSSFRSQQGLHDFMYTGSADDMNVFLQNVQLAEGYERILTILNTDSPSDCSYYNTCVLMQGTELLSTLWKSTQLLDSFDAALARLALAGSIDPSGNMDPTKFPHSGEQKDLRPYLTLLSRVIPDYTDEKLCGIITENIADELGAEASGISPPVGSIVSYPTDVSQYLVMNKKGKIFEDTFFFPNTVYDCAHTKKTPYDFPTDFMSDNSATMATSIPTGPVASMFFSPWHTKIANATDQLVYAATFNRQKESKPYAHVTKCLLLMSSCIILHLFFAVKRCISWVRKCRHKERRHKPLSVVDHVMSYAILVFLILHTAFFVHEYTKIHSSSNEHEDTLPSQLTTFYIHLVSLNRNVDKTLNAIVGEHGTEIEKIDISKTVVELVCLRTLFDSQLWAYLDAEQSSRVDSLLRGYQTVILSCYPLLDNGGTEGQTTVANYIRQKQTDGVLPTLQFDEAQHMENALEDVLSNKRDYALDVVAYKHETGLADELGKQLENILLTTVQNVRDIEKAEIIKQRQEEELSQLRLSITFIALTVILIVGFFLRLARLAKKVAAHEVGVHIPEHYFIFCHVVIIVLMLAGLSFLLFFLGVQLTRSSLREDFLQLETRNTLLTTAIRMVQNALMRNDIVSDVDLLSVFDKVTLIKQANFALHTLERMADEVLSHNAHVRNSLPNIVTRTEEIYTGLRTNWGLLKPVIGELADCLETMEPADAHGLLSLDAVDVHECYTIDRVEYIHSMLDERAESSFASEADDLMLVVREALGSKLQAADRRNFAHCIFAATVILVLSCIYVAWLETQKLRYIHTSKKLVVVEQSF